MKKRLLNLTMLFIICLSNLIIAQTPNWDWAKRAGGISGEESNSICTDASGNVFIAGSFFSSTITFGSTTLNNSGLWDIFIVKYDAAGNVLWAKSAGGTDYDYAYSITTDASGNVIITGIFKSPAIAFDTTTLTNTGVNDIFIVKYDSSGNMIWARSAGGADDDKCNSVATDANGNIFITGIFWSPAITFGITTLTNSGYSDIFIAKYDSGGNVLWATSAGGNDTDVGNSIATDASGNAVITGKFNSPTIIFGTTTLTKVGQNDFFIAKYDTAGNVLWANSAGGLSNDEGTCIVTDAQGNIFAIGLFYGNPITFGSTTLTNAGANDFFVVKYNASGNVIWAKSQGSTANDGSQSITADSDGSVYITGWFQSPSLVFGTTTLSNAGLADLYIAKYDTSGNVLWAKSAGSSDYDQAYSVTVNASGAIFLTGKFQSNSITFGTTTLTNASPGHYDIFITKLGICSTLSTINASACNSYISPSGNYTWTASGIYTDIIPNAAGCDSIITINLSINTVDTSVTQNGNVLTANATSAVYQWLDCNNSFAMISGASNQVFAPIALGNYAVVITLNGCTDTSACFTVCSTSSSIIDTACNSYISPSGNYIWNSSGTYFDTIPNSAGCDSMITINLTINTVDTSVSQNGNVLTANATSAVYQWLDCNNNFAWISGATNQVFAPTAIGNYAAAITINGCTDTSGCYAVIGVGISEQGLTNKFEIYPNPVNEIMIIRYPLLAGTNVAVSLSDVTGKVIYSSRSRASDKLEVNTANFSKGIYVVKLQTTDFVETRKMIKN